MSEDWRQTVEKNVKELYEEESWEVGSRLARATKAREDGYSEVAALMEEIAQDEARHLSLVVRLLHPEEVERDVRTNLEAMIEADRAAAGREERLAAIARQAGMKRESELLQTLAKDELDHAAKLEAALQQLGHSIGPLEKRRGEAMDKAKELKVIEESGQEQAAECCVPLCGPTTCESGAEAVEAEVVEAKVVEEPKKASSGCGPSTCS